MSAIPGIAVFDIGKTNKKYFFFNEDYEIVEEEVQHFYETKDEDGFPCDDIALIGKWVKEKLAGKLKDPRIQVKAVNFSTYGASFVHVNAEGRPVAPLYNYLKPFPEDLGDLFYYRYGGREQFATETASPVLGNLNSGLQLYRIKEQLPHLFSEIRTSLHLPQYFGFLVHGNAFSDITSIGCHTALWNFGNNGYHRWVTEEGILGKLAPLFASGAAIETIAENGTLKCGVGLHDSSAAFIPYMNLIQEPFVLLSTGTWSISMNPFNKAPLTTKELQQDCLSYLTYKGMPLKASRLFAGNEHEEEVKKLAAFYHVNTAYFHSIRFAPELVEPLSSTDTPAAYSFSGGDTIEKAYHNLVQHLVRKQKYSTELVLKDTDVKQLYVDGGFARNEVFMNLIARAFPELAVYAASVSQATAVGAAMAIHDAWNTRERTGQLLEVKRYRAE
ncbi:FGGY-family carbohydrate kinase [Niabella drilacis]|uniref:Sugar (Pentulose or hexulose) kinase n=1 Tax=Niabella drilacis (strain DSM 25811 / CCM 8410 / CCUG 62505 / LMG 26954 / E90) TaxID=1285928 RepID=A0A1G6JVC2_NIADE|nr:FGGY-family carbohydrate kinase [Niabella drilacis]SDC22664.1 Sugar (pentulose or hexulose) kinase [Niabella drilacis]